VAVSSRRPRREAIVEVASELDERAVNVIEANDAIAQLLVQIHRRRQEAAG
jgi:hypothetical protein